MVDNIRIETGIKRIIVNDDPDRVVEFNPQDVVFAERWYALIQEYRKAEEDFITHAKELEAVTETDDIDLPINTKERIKFVRELCEWERSQIDNLFGEGTSQAAFGNALEIDMFEQFFSSISPFIESARKEKTQKYNKVLADRKKIEDTKAIMD